MKNKKFAIDVTVPLDMYAVLEMNREMALEQPERFAKYMREFGFDGDWTLELAYLKLIKKDIKTDFGKEASDMLQKVIEIIEKG